MVSPQPILCRRCLDRADLGFVRPLYTHPVCVVPMPDFVEEIGAACAAVREDGKRMFMRVSQ